METRFHLLDTFFARGGDGAQYKVRAFECQVRDESILVDGHDRWEPTGKLEYRLDGGERLTLGADGTLREVSTGLTLTREDAAVTA